MLMPHAIRRQDDGLVIVWDEGAEGKLLEARALRLSCPCAGCHDEMTGVPLLTPSQVPEDIRPVSVALVGTYGLRVTWSDGHDTGIYTFDALQRVSQPSVPSEERSDG
jgi:ATP-binding protein involved in chromosome partitioning